MLVRHEHRVEISQRMPGVGDVSRIEKNSRVVSLGQDGRMPQVSDPHCTTVWASGLVTFDWVRGGLAA
jgi:hypothetical protein